MARRLICRLFHWSIPWPFNGKYTCARCGTKWPALQPSFQKSRRRYLLNRAGA